MVAAAQLGRRYVGYDLDPAYVEIARRRVEEEGAPVPAVADVRGVGQIAEEAVREAGFGEVRSGVRIAGSGAMADLVGTDGAGGTWCFLVAGPNTSVRGGMARAEVVWQAIGRATAIRAAKPDARVVLLTTVPPKPRSEPASALRSVTGTTIEGVVDLFDPADRARLKSYAR